jgi:methionine-S-sulfoxide reductase
MSSEMTKNNTLETSTLGGGCFWCTEAIYKSLKGVTEVLPGYSGGVSENPTYQEVCTGNTGHAEVIQITFDNQRITFDEILEIFFKVHDPTTLNRQGNDIGTQYRSVIFYHTDAQKISAERLIAQINHSAVHPDPVVTEVSPFKTFYPAEDYHQNYFERNKNQPYCSFVVAPKVEKFKKMYIEKLK